MVQIRLVVVMIPTVKVSKQAQCVCLGVCFRLCTIRTLKLGDAAMHRASVPLVRLFDVVFIDALNVAKWDPER